MAAFNRKSTKRYSIRVCGVYLSIAMVVLIFGSTAVAIIGGRSGNRNTESSNPVESLLSAEKAAFLLDALDVGESPDVEAQQRAKEFLSKLQSTK
jgi:hypothetical protein